MPPSATPTHLDLSRDKGLPVKWADGSQSFYDVKYLRLMSPSAEQRELREQMERNPLTVLPASAAHSSSEPLAAVRAERDLPEAGTLLRSAAAPRREST